MDKMSEGVVTLVIGMTIVFSVLIILWAMLLGFKQIFYVIPNKKKENKANVISEITTDKTPIVEQKDEDGEIVAVITAAICSLTGQNSSNFKIKSIRRISNWNK